MRHRHWDVFCDRSDQRRTIDGQSVSMPVEWPVEITDFQWALYNQNGELCVEATTDISQAESGVTLLLTGDGNLDDVQEIFE